MRAAIATFVAWGFFIGMGLAQSVKDESDVAQQLKSARGGQTSTCKVVESDYAKCDKAQNKCDWDQQLNKYVSDVYTGQIALYEKSAGSEVEGDTSYSYESDVCYTRKLCDEKDAQGKCNKCGGGSDTKVNHKSTPRGSSCKGT